MARHCKETSRGFLQCRKVLRKDCEFFVIWREVLQKGRGVLQKGCGVLQKGRGVFVDLSEEVGGDRVVLLKGSSVRFLGGLLQKHVGVYF
jgi:hypothetical protein